MALDTAPLLLRQRKFAFDLETTTGTFKSLTNANGVTRVLNPSITYDIELVERDDESSISNSKAEFGAKSANVTFQTWLAGSGATGIAYWTRLLKSCGMSEAGGVFSPVTGATETTSFGCYYAGSRAKYAAGCQGNGVFTFSRARPVTADWSYTGKYIAPAADALTTPTYDTIISPSVASLTIGGVTTYRMPDISFDMGNEVVLREDVSETLTGYRSAYIVDRSPRVRVSPEAFSLSTKNWYADMLAGNTVAMEIVVGNAANNTITFDFPALQLVTPPNEEDRDKMLTEVLEFVPIKASDGGNDEYTITFS